MFIKLQQFVDGSRHNLGEHERALGPLTKLIEKANPTVILAQLG